MRPTMFEMLRRTWQPKGLKEIIVQEGSATEKLFISLLIVLTCFSIRGICARAKKRVFFTELYHFAVILTLAALSATYPIIPSIISFMVLFYIVIEIIIWTIFDIFVESKLPELQGRRNSLRAFLWAIYCYLVVIWAYALYFVISGKIVDGNQNSLPGIVTALYYSVITITTIGYGDFIPARDNGASLVQLIVASEPLVGILLLSVYLATFVSIISSDFRSTRGSNIE